MKFFKSILLSTTLLLTIYAGTSISNKANAGFLALITAGTSGLALGGTALVVTAASTTYAKHYVDTVEDAPVNTIKNWLFIGLLLEDGSISIDTKQTQTLITKEAMKKGVYLDNTESSKLAEILISTEQIIEGEISYFLSAPENKTKEIMSSADYREEEINTVVNMLKQ